MYKGVLSKLGTRQRSDFVPRIESTTASGICPQHYIVMNENAHNKGQQNQPSEGGKVMKDAVRKSLQKQVDYATKVREKTGLNMVDCCNCGYLLLHSSDNPDEDILCPNCEKEVNVNDCCDVYFREMLGVFTQR